MAKENYITEMDLDNAPLGITEFFKYYPNGDYRKYLKTYKYCKLTLKEIDRL